MKTVAWPTLITLAITVIAVLILAWMDRPLAGSALGIVGSVVTALLPSLVRDDP